MFSPHYPRINDLDSVPIKAPFFFCPFVYSVAHYHRLHTFSGFSLSDVLSGEQEEVFVCVSAEIAGVESHKGDSRFSSPSSLEDG